MLVQYAIVITHKQQTGYSVANAPWHVFTPPSVKGGLTPSRSSKILEFTADERLFPSSNWGVSDTLQIPIQPSVCASTPSVFAIWLHQTSQTRKQYGLVQAIHITFFGNSLYILHSWYKRLNHYANMNQKGKLLLLCAGTISWPSQ